MRGYRTRQKKTRTLGSNSTEWKQFYLDPSVSGPSASSTNKGYKSNQRQTKREIPVPDSPASKKITQSTPQSNIASRVRSRRRNQENANGSSLSNANSRKPLKENLPRSNAIGDHLSSPKQTKKTESVRPSQPSQLQQSFATHFATSSKPTQTFKRRRTRRTQAKPSVLNEHFRPPSRRELRKKNECRSRSSSPRVEEGERGKIATTQQTSRNDDYFESPRSLKTRQIFQSLSISENSSSNASVEPVQKSKRKRKSHDVAPQPSQQEAMSLDDIVNDTVDPEEEFYHPDYVMHELKLPHESEFQQEDMDEDGEEDLPVWARTTSPRKRPHSQISETTTPSMTRSESFNGQPPLRKRKPPAHVMQDTERIQLKRRASRESLNGTRMTFYSEEGGLLWKTPKAPIREQRQFRLAQKSNSFIMAEVLLGQENEHVRKRRADYTPFKLKRSRSDPCQFEPKRSRRQKVGVRFNGSCCAGKMSNIQAGMIKGLIEEGADVNYKTLDGVSVLFLLVHYTNVIEIVRMMVDRGAVCTTVCTVNDVEVSILDVALRSGETETIEFLLEHEALPTAHSLDIDPKRNLLEFAYDHGFRDFAFTKLRDGLFESVANLDLVHARGVIRHGLPVDTMKSDEIGKTALYETVTGDLSADRKEEHVNMIMFLLNEGASANFVCDETPMMCRVLERTRAGYESEIVKLLLEHGADLNLEVGGTGGTVFDYAKNVAADPRYFVMLRNHMKSS